MIVPFRIWLIGVVLLVPCVGSAQENQSATDLPTVAELVEQLSSKERKVRESAERQLIARDPEILDQLPEYDAVKSPDLRSALFRIRSELENRKIEQSLLSTTLRFPIRDLTLEEAVAFIREKTGNDLRIAESLEIPKTRIHFRVAEVTFWEAVLHMIDTYDLDLEVSGNGRGLVFVAKKTGRKYFTNEYDKSKHPVLPVVWRLNKVERKPIEGRNDRDLLRLELQLLWEPRLSPMFIKWPGHQKAAARLVTRDEPGRTDREDAALPPFSPEAVTEIPCHQLPISPAFRMDWTVPADSEVLDVAILLQAEVMLAIGRFDFVFGNWDQPRISARRGLGVVVRDELVVTDNEVSFLLMLLFSERGAPFESHREWLSQNLIELKAGDRILKPKAPPEKELEADGSVAFRYRFARPQGAPDDWTLHYRFPTRFREVTVRGSELIEMEEWLKPQHK